MEYATLALLMSLIGLTNQRYAVASQMATMLEAAAFKGQALDEGQAQHLIAQGQARLDQIQALQPPAKVSKAGPAAQVKKPSQGRPQRVQGPATPAKATGAIRERVGPLGH